MNLKFKSSQKDTFKIIELEFKNDILMAKNNEKKYQNLNVGGTQNENSWCVSFQISMSIDLF